MNRYLFLSLDFFRGNQLDGLNSETPDTGEIKPANAALPSVSSSESSNDQANSGREEEIELWMKNIKEFIRGIDVKSL